MISPYNTDGWLITSQIVSIVAWIISFVWWLPHTIGFVTMICMQIVWCCRMKYGGLLALGILNAICGVASVIAAVYIFIQWPNDTWCNVYTLFVHPHEYPTYYNDNGQGENQYYNYYYCNYRAWASVELIAAVLWFVAAYGPLHFIISGKLAAYNLALQERIDEEVNAGAATAIEMGTIPTSQTSQMIITSSTLPSHGGGGGVAVATIMAPARIITEVDPETNQTMGKYVTAIPTN